MVFSLLYTKTKTILIEKNNINKFSFQGEPVKKHNGLAIKKKLNYFYMHDK